MINIPLFEIKLDDTIISIDHQYWSEIQQRVRSNKWFYLKYNNNKYKYVDDKKFAERSTIFYFKHIDDDYSEEIEILNID